ncbi:hypothetical protein C8J57DRAFT_1394114 [Mycena rebaudengoi]|nr:hypothetical protein C8J57DRAFT_1394114 [Mycena rebaudengoi]
MRLTAAAVALTIFGVSSAAPIESGPEARSVLGKWPVIHNTNVPRVVTDEPVLRKRPIIQNQNQIVGGPVHAKRPGKSPTSIEGAGTLQKRPVVQNDSRISPIAITGLESCYVIAEFET